MLYAKLLKSDVKDLRFKERSFDVVICFHVTERLTQKEEGNSLIKNLEKIAKKKSGLSNVNWTSASKRICLESTSGT